MAVILKAREPARILVAIGGKLNECPHLELKQRWVNQYNFYLNDQYWGPMFVRMCPYFPFSARVTSVRKEIRRVHEGRRTGWAVSEKQTGLFANSHEA